LVPSSTACPRERRRVAQQYHLRALWAKSATYYIAVRSYGVAD
jgi:hypothetical protein